MEVYSGPLLPDQSESWIDAERQDLQTKHLGALIEHTEYLLDAGQVQDALASALKAVRSDPFHEPSRRSAIRAFVELGDLGGALRQFSEYERALAKEYGVRPSDALQTLVQDLTQESKSSQAPDASASPALEPPPVRLAPPPIFLDRIVGRDDELGLLTEWLTADHPVRLTVITGPGGVGKTRLACALAAKVADTFDGNVVFVALADLEPGQRVRSKIQSAFGIQGASGGSAPLPEWGKKPCLLILDNAEHLVADVRSESKEILLSHPGVCILATSRQKLGLGGERELPLTPLDVPDLAGGEKTIENFAATELFLERAKAVRPNYEVAAEQIEPLVLLLERLDGLPLAIELAAARIAFMTPEQMLQEIDDRFTFLVSRRSDVEPRQRSLRATIDWSFRGLDDDLKEVLYVLSVFRGGCTLDILKKATGRSDAIEIMQDLAERSLVHQEEGPDGVRFNMLEAIRHYLLELVEPARLAEIRKVHAQIIADYMFQTSRDMDAVGGANRYDLIRLDMDNALTAIDWALEHDRELASVLGASLWRFWTARGRPRDGVETLDRIIERPPDVFTKFYAECCLGRGAIAATLGEHVDGVHYHGKSAKIYESLENDYGWRWASMNQTFSLLEIGRNQEAVDLAEKILITRDPGSRGYLLHALARTLPRLGRAEEGMAAAEEAFAEWVGRKEVLLKGRAYMLLADAYSDCGRMEGVHGLLRQAIDLLRESRVQNFLVRALCSMAKEELRRGDMDAFATVSDEAHELAVKLGDQKVLVLVEGLLARSAAMEGDLPGMARRYEAALMAAANPNRCIDLVTLAIMAAHDFAHSGFPNVAVTAVASLMGLQKTFDPGMTPSEQRELEAAQEVIGDVEPVSSVSSGQDLASRVLAVSAEIR